MFGFSSYDKLENKMRSSLLAISQTTLFSFAMFEDLLLMHAEVLEQLEDLALGQITKEDYLKWQKEFDNRVKAHRKKMLEASALFKSGLNDKFPPLVRKPPLKVPVR